MPYIISYSILAERDASPSAFQWHQDTLHNSEDLLHPVPPELRCDQSLGGHHGRSRLQHLGGVSSFAREVVVQGTRLPDQRVGRRSACGHRYGWQIECPGDLGWFSFKKRRSRWLRGLRWVVDWCCIVLKGRLFMPLSLFVLKSIWLFLSTGVSPPSRNRS